MTPNESLSGNHALVEARPIAAVNAATPAQAEVYSSQGPSTISFPFLEVRPVPVLTSVDCVRIKTGALGFFGQPFCGTSAAAPHVAGIAALLIERAPTLSTEPLRGVRTGTAVDLGAPGFDFTYGFGRVDAFAAVDRRRLTSPQRLRSARRSCRAAAPCRSATPRPPSPRSWRPGPARRPGARSRRQTRPQERHSSVSKPAAS